MQVLLDKTYVLENPAGSDIFTDEVSPLSPLRALPHHVQRLDQCMLGAELEHQAIRKTTDLQSNRKRGRTFAVMGATHTSNSVVLVLAAVAQPRRPNTHENCASTSSGT